MAAVTNGDAVVPGDRLCLTSDFCAGEGTLARHNSLYSTMTGIVRTDFSHSPIAQISVERQKKLHHVPKEGAVVVCKILNVTQRQAKAKILSVNGKVLPDQLRGVIRKEDVRSTERDSVDMFNSFRPGDFVRARVISLGDSQGYTLSTAENELGVLLGTSDNGGLLLPTSWCEMECADTRIREKRKVAKVVHSVPAP